MIANDERLGGAHGFFTTICIITGRDRVKKFEHATSRYSHSYGGEKVADGNTEDAMSLIRSLLRADLACIGVYNPTPEVMSMLLDASQTGHAIIVSMPGTFDEAVAAFASASPYPLDSQFFYDVPDGFLHDASVHISKESAASRIGTSSLLKAGRRLHLHNAKISGSTVKWGALDPDTRERYKGIVIEVVEAVWEHEGFGDEESGGLHDAAYVLIQTRSDDDGETLHWSTATVEQRAAAIKTAKSVFLAAM